MIADDRNRMWWRAEVERHKPRAFAKSPQPVHPRSSRVKHLFSSGRLDGTEARYYAFSCPADHATFLRAHPGCIDCTDPLT